MEFWGVEVKPGDSLNVTPETGKLIHISQAALGEVKNSKGAASVPLHLKIGDGKFVLGTLSAEGRPQLTFDLVFEKEFELSHDWKNGSVYFCGYTADNPYAEDQLGSDSEFSDEEEEEDNPLNTNENGKHEPNIGGAKPAKSKATLVKPESSAKTKVTLAEPKKDEESLGAEDSDSEDDSEFGSSDDMFESDDSDDDDDDESDEEDEETPKKDEPTKKKRPSESAIKTPVPAKKGKSDTPQKTDGKKGSVHTATPHPGKSNKAKEQTPKSSGQSSCTSCSKTFNSDGALQSHVKAKHGGK